MTEPRYFVVNLDRSPERLADTRAAFARLGLDVERVPAVDGVKLAPEEIAAAYDGRFSLDANMYLNAYLVAITLSHVAALRAFLATGAAYGVVLEDDVGFSRAAIDLVDGLVADHRAGRIAFDAVEFTGPTSPKTDVGVVVRREGPFTLARPRKPTPFAGFTLVTRPAARRLADTAIPIRTHWDNHLSMSWLHGVRFLTVRPFPVHERPGNPSLHRRPEIVPDPPTRGDRLRREAYLLWQGPRRLVWNLGWLGPLAVMRVPGRYTRLPRVVWRGDDDGA